MRTKWSKNTYNIVDTVRSHKKYVQRISLLSIGNSLDCMPLAQQGLYNNQKKMYKKEIFGINGKWVKIYWSRNETYFLLASNFIPPAPPPSHWMIFRILGFGWMIFVASVYPSTVSFLVLLFYYYMGFVKI